MQVRLPRDLLGDVPLLERAVPVGRSRGRSARVQDIAEDGSVTADDGRLNFAGALSGTGSWRVRRLVTAVGTVTRWRLARAASMASKFFRTMSLPFRA
jgi:hypothetical protein